MIPSLFLAFFRSLYQVLPTKSRGHSQYGQSVQSVAYGRLIVGCVEEGCVYGLGYGQVMGDGKEGP